MRKLILIIALTLLHSSIFSFQNQDNNYELRLRKAIELVFNFQFKEAEQKLLELSEINKSDSRPFLYLSNIYVWKFIGDQQKSDFEKFENFSKQTIQRAENILKTNRDDLWSFYSLSSIYGYRSLMYFMNRDYLDGLWSVKKSISWTDDLIKKNPNFYDGYLWRGIIYFSLHQVPSAFRSFLSIVGLEGDIKQGLKDIQLVSKKGDLAKVEANYFLSQFYSSSLNDNQKAYELLRDLSSKYPDNELFVYSTAVELIKLHRIDEAKTHLFRIVKNNSVEIKAIKELSYFLLGDCFFYQNEFKDAITYYEIFLNQYKQNQYKPTACFRAGLSFYFIDDNKKATYYLEKCTSINSKVSEDKFYQRYAKKILNSNFDQKILKIFLAWNYLRSGKFELAISRFDEILNSNKNNDLKIVLRYLIGLSYYKMNDTTNSKKNFNEVIRMNSKDELWAKAFAYLYLARLEFSSRNYQASDNYITKILDMDNFDFENSVKSQAKNLRERIKNNF